jgi:hypothetical protein
LLAWDPPAVRRDADVLVLAHLQGNHGQIISESSMAFACLVALSLGSPVDSPALFTVVADGLQAPRGLAFGTLAGSM